MAETKAFVRAAARNISQSWPRMSLWSGATFGCCNYREIPGDTREMGREEQFGRVGKK